MRLCYYFTRMIFWLIFKMHVCGVVLFVTIHTVPCISLQYMYDIEASICNYSENLHHVATNISLIMPTNI